MVEKWQRPLEPSETPVEILVVDDNNEFRATVAEYLQRADSLTVVGTAGDGEEALRQIERLNPSVVVLDLVMPHLDGIGVLERIYRNPTRPRVIVLSAFGDERLVGRAYELGAIYFIMKPFPLSLLATRISQLAHDFPMKARRSKPMPQRTDVERYLSRLMAELGIPSHYKGYSYLREAILVVVEDTELRFRMTKILYARIAETFSTTPAKVERSIRHAIETAWTRGNLELINELFAYTVNVDKGRPTNSSFIAQVADRVRLALRAG